MVPYIIPHLILKHHNKDTTFFLITQVVYELYYPYLCTDALSPTTYHTTEHHNKDTTYPPHNQIIRHIVIPLLTTHVEPPPISHHRGDTH